MIIEKNNSYLGDCLDILPFVTEKTIDLILCDLPYGTTKAKWDSVIDLQFHPLERVD